MTLSHSHVAPRQAEKFRQAKANLGPKQVLVQMDFAAAYTVPYRGELYGAMVPQTCTPLTTDVVEASLLESERVVFLELHLVPVLCGLLPGQRG